VLELSTRLVLPAHPSSLRLGRHATIAWLQLAPRRYDKDTVLLLVTEVLADALNHSSGPVVLSVATVAGAVDGQLQLRVEVVDHAPVEMLAADEVARAGQHPHLRMTAVLADRWGVEIGLADEASVRVVWFECRPLVVGG
jgi:hypothetical protein